MGQIRNASKSHSLPLTFLFPIMFSLKTVSLALASAGVAQANFLSARQITDKHAAEPSSTPEEQLAIVREYLPSQVNEHCEAKNTDDAKLECYKKDTKALFTPELIKNALRAKLVNAVEKNSPSTLLQKRSGDILDNWWNAIWNAGELLMKWVMSEPVTSADLKHALKQFAHPMKQTVDLIFGTNLAATKPPAIQAPEPEAPNAPAAENTEA